LFLERYDGDPNGRICWKPSETIEELGIVRLFFTLDDRERVSIEDRHGSFPLSRPRISVHPTQTDDFVEDRIVFKSSGLVLPPPRRFFVELAELVNLLRQHLQFRLEGAQRYYAGL
jgi:hypothetical protein